MWTRLKNAGERVIAALNRWADRIEAHVNEMDAQPVPARADDAEASEPTEPTEPVNRVAAHTAAGNGKKTTAKSTGRA